MEPEKKQLILVGGGGHGRSLLDVVERHGEFAVAGIVDLPGKKGREVLGYAIVGSDSDLPGLVATGAWFLVGVGQIETAEPRVRIFGRLKEMGAPLPVIVSPLGYLSPHARAGEGTVVFHGAIVNAGAAIGENVIVNTGALVEHDVTVGDHVHLATRSVVNGGVRIGDRVFIGSGAVIREGISVASDAFIGAGSLVTRDMPRGTRVKGVY